MRSAPCRPGSRMVMPSPISVDSIIFNLQIFRAGTSPSPTSRKRLRRGLDGLDRGVVRGSPGATRPLRMRTTRGYSVVPGTARPDLGAQRRMLRCNRLNHIGKLSFMSNTSPHSDCKNLCAAKPLFRQGKLALARRALGRDAMSAARKISRTSPHLPVEPAGTDGPESFKGRRRACAPRRIPDRVPVTAGIRSETAMRPLG